MTTMLAQLGAKDESTYGTPVTVDRFWEFNTCTIEKQRGRVVSRGLRASTGRVARTDRFMPYTIGAAGAVTMDVPTKGFGWWLKHMMGASATTGPTDSNYTHTGTVGSLYGDFFTLQANKPLHPAGTNQAFTWHGCKVTSWELACDLDGVLVATLNIDAEDEDRSTGLASASYASDYRVFTFDGAAVTLEGSSFPVKNIRISGDNALVTDRRFIKASSLKSEPTENDYRTYTATFDAEFSSTTEYAIFDSATAAGQLATLIATFDGPVAHGGTTLPRLTATIQEGTLDVSAPIEGPNGIMQRITMTAMYDGTNSACTVAYRTTDATA